MARKHLIIANINKKQQAQAKIWQKLAREIKAAAKIGGVNVDANPRLKMAIDKAVQNGLSSESIERNLHGNKKDDAELINIEYECYGPNGIQIIVKALADNTNRVASNLRGFLSKLHGEIAKPNSVKIFFDNLGYILVEKTNNLTIDDIMEYTINNNIVDINEFDNVFEIKTTPADFYSARDNLKNNKCIILDSEIKLIAQNKITKLDHDAKERFNKFISSCEEDDDIQ
jgi:YebC/PmpR family DNA-binding regulatory protein